MKSGYVENFATRDGKLAKRDAEGNMYEYPRPDARIYPVKLKIRQYI